MKNIFILTVCIAVLGVAYAQNCGKDEYECSDGSCIPEWWACDGDNDCGDRSDEPDDCGWCPIGMIECDNYQCTFDDWMCDGEDDCGDWSDEGDRYCPCDDNELKCPPFSSGRPGGCVPPEYVCDPEGIWDCHDGSDQFNCTNISVNKVHKARVASVRNVDAAQKKSEKAKKNQRKAMINLIKKFPKAVAKEMMKNKSRY